MELNKIYSFVNISKVIKKLKITILHYLHSESGKAYAPDSEKSYDKFTDWLRCYNVEGMKNLQASIIYIPLLLPSRLDTLVYWLFFRWIMKVQERLTRRSI
jgi:hypothetical protein